MAPKRRRPVVEEAELPEVSDTEDVVDCANDVNEEGEGGGDDDEVFSITELLSSVNNNVEENEIRGDLNDFENEIAECNWGVFEKVFPSLASLTSLVSSCEDWQLRAQLAKGLTKSCAVFRQAIINFASDYATSLEANEPVERNPSLQKATTYYVLLVQRLCDQMQREVQRRQRENQLTGRKRKNDDVDSLVEEWKSKHRLNLVISVKSLLSLTIDTDLRAYKNILVMLWKPDVIDPEFLRTIVSMTISFLDDIECLRSNAAVNEWLRHIYSILKQLCCDYGLIDDVARALVEKTLSFEFWREGAASSYPYIAPIVEAGYNKNDQTLRPLLVTITKLICSLSSTQGGHVKPLGLAIQAMGKEIPEMLMTHLSQLFQLLDSENPTLRSAMLSTLTEILMSNYLSEVNCVRIPLRGLCRKMLFNRILSHTKDVSAPTRARAIHSFQDLISAKKVPMQVYRQGCIGFLGRRLVDNKQSVRKVAATALFHFLQNNPFGHDFNPVLHREKFDLLVKQLKQLDELNPENQVAAEAEKQWSVIEPKIRSALFNEVRAYIRTRVTPCEEVEGVDAVILVQTALESIGEEQFDNAAKLFMRAAVLLTMFEIDEEMDITEERKRILDLLVGQVGEKFMHLKVSEGINNFQTQLDVEGKVEDLDRQRKTVQANIELLQDKLVIEKELKECVQLALRGAMMGESSEMRECMRFLVECSKFTVSGSEHAIRSLCSLFFRSGQEHIKDLLSFVSDIFKSKNPNERVREESTLAALLSAMDDISEEDRPGVEEAITRMQADESFSIGVINRLWRVAEQETGELKERVTALRVLYAICRAPEGLAIAKSRLRTLQKLLHHTSVIAVEALAILTCIGRGKINLENEREVLEPAFRIPNSDSLFTTLKKLFIIEMTKVKSNAHPWFHIMQRILDILYHLPEEVDSIIPEFAGLFMHRVRKAGQFYLYYSIKEREYIGTKKEIAADRRLYWKLTWMKMAERLVAFIGEVTLQLNEYSASTLPQMHRKYEAMIRYGESNFNTLPEEEPHLLTHIELLMILRNEIFAYSSTAGGSDADLRMLTENLRAVRVFSHHRLISRLWPIVIFAVRAASSPLNVRHAAVTALGKFIPLSEPKSDMLAPMFVTLLARTINPVMRSNLLASFADFAFSHSNMFELYSQTLFKMATDADPVVRESTILVLSCLSSNGIIHPRSNLCEAAKCLYDETLSVQTIAASFFRELNRKENSLDDLTPQFMHRLSCTAEKIPFPQYQQMFDYLISLAKEKGPATVEKMLERIMRYFKDVELIIQEHPDAPKYLAYCMSRFSLTDKTFQTLKDNIRHYSKFLYLPVVYDCVTDLAASHAKSSKNAEVKAQIEYFIQQCDSVRTNGLTADVLTVPVPKTKQKRTTAATPTAKRTTRKRAQAQPASDDDSD